MEAKAMRLELERQTQRALEADNGSNVARLVSIFIGISTSSDDQIRSAYKAFITPRGLPEANDNPKEDK